MRYGVTTNPTSDAAPRHADAPPRRRWLRRLVVAAFLLGVLAIFHEPMLRGVALGLVADSSDGPADAVVVMGGYGPFGAVPLEEAARRSQRNPALRVLVVEDRSARTVRLGIVPTLESVVRPDLETRGVPANAIVVLVVTTPGDYDSIRRLRDWLADHPEQRVTLLCEQLSSRRTAAMLRQTLAAAEADRVALQPIPDRRVTPDTWWRSRQGIVAVFSEYTALACVLARGEEEHPPEWDADQYEQSLSPR